MKYAQARQNMVDGQLRPNKVTENVILSRFSQVPRELFVPPAVRNIAYQDTPVHLTAERVLISPLVTARLLQAVNPQPNHKVLVLAAGSGYTAALLCGLVKHVYVVEGHKQLRQAAVNVLTDVGCNHVDVVAGTPAEGYAAKAPYDLIWVEGAVEEIPPALWQQLVPHGRIAAISNGKNGVAEATVFTKQGKSFFTEGLFETKQLPLVPGFESSEEFTF